MSRTTILDITYEILGCADCGVTIFISEEVIDRRRKDGKSFYCHNGHENYFRDNENKTLRERAVRAEWQRDSFKSEAGEFKRSNAALKGQITKLNKLKK